MSPPAGPAWGIPTCWRSAARRGPSWAAPPTAARPGPPVIPPAPVVTWLGLPAEQRRPTCGWTPACRRAVARPGPVRRRDLPATNWSEPAGVSKMNMCAPSGLLPTQACPNVVSEVFLDGNEPTGLDTLYRTFRSTARPGCWRPCSPRPSWWRTALTWLPPEAQAGANWPACRCRPRITTASSRRRSCLTCRSPARPNLAVVHGAVNIHGVAAGAGFSYYQLQAGQGLNPQNWLPVGESRTPMHNGKLAYGIPGSGCSRSAAGGAPGPEPGNGYPEGDGG